MDRLDNPLIGLSNLKRFLENLIKTKVLEREDGKGLSTNDLTDELKESYDNAYIHSVSPHAPVDAQANVIERIRLSGELLLVDHLKTVDIDIPSGLEDLEEVTNSEIDEIFRSWVLTDPYEEATIEEIDSLFD